MCFSATASFVLSAGLVPTGLYAMATARRANPEWLPFAAYPLAFGIQQAFEGVVWLGIAGGSEATVALAGRGFLFFSHLFWLAWVPFSVWMIETAPARRRAAGALTVIGLLYGLSISMPSLLIGDWLDIILVNRSLEYLTTLIYDGYVGRFALRMVYAAIVVGALILSSDRRIRFFGVLVCASLAVTYAFFAYAFISVWCFLAAALSVYLVVIVVRDSRPAVGVAG